MKRTACAAFATVLMSGVAMAQVVYNRGNDAEPETLDVHKTSTVYEAHILRDLYEGLVDPRRQGRGRCPASPRSWEIVRRRQASTASSCAPTPNGRTATRSRRPTSSSPSAASWTRRPARNTPTSSIPIQNAEKINKGQAEARGARRQGGRRPHARDHARAADALLPRAADPPDRPAGASGRRSRSTARTSSSPRTWSPTAPTCSTEFVPNSHIKLDKNPHFHDAANVKIDTVIFYPTKDLAAARAPLPGRRAALDDRHSGRPDQVPEGDARRPGQARALSRHLLPRRQHRRRRRSTTCACARRCRWRSTASSSPSEIWGGTMLPAYSFVPPGIGNYGEPADADYKDMSPIDREDKAKALLKEAGFGAGGKPLKVEIRYNTTDNNQNTVGRDRRPVEGDRRRDHLHQHRRQDPLRASARRRRLRRRPRRLDRRLFRPAELPVPRPVATTRASTTRKYKNPEFDDADEARPPTETDLDEARRASCSRPSRSSCATCPTSR